MIDQPKRLAIFGATGTIGDNTLAIVRAHPALFRVSVLTAGNNAQKLIALALEFQPDCVVINDDTYYAIVRAALPAHINVLSGEEGLCEAAALDYDLMICAIVGFAALKPTITAIRAHRAIALANKECLIAAGALFMAECRIYNTVLLPIDSEHNGLFQLWQGIGSTPPAFVTLTASGGALRRMPIELLCNATPAETVAHPNWNMGAKISVDSATLMNKGLELIEAQHLFDVSAEQLGAIIHPQSIIHCLIAFNDGSHLAQLALPDMRTPIAYALQYPQRLTLDLPPLSLSDIGTLTFEPVNHERFPCLNLAITAMKEGGCAPAILNAANEVAVAAFLAGRIRFTQIAPLIERALTKITRAPLTTLDDVIAIHHLSSSLTEAFISEK